MRLFKPESVPRPKLGASIPLEELSPPWDLEIGCGSGDFAIQWANKTKNPLIAIEKTHSRFFKFQKKISGGKRPKNLWPIHSNAVWWLTHFGKKNIFENIFILYPNPYPKKKQAHLRWVNRPFMSFLLDMLKVGGHLELRTNQYDYYEEFITKIKKFPCLKIKEKRTINDSSLAQSLFEKKYLERNEKCYVLVVKKI